MDVYFPTLKEISLVYRPNILNPAVESFNFTEEEPFYNREPFTDKIEELAEESNALQLPLP